ncbi:hypothetical protein KFZ70_09345 [Tamlana fucoidanivorans]|uniref:Glycosyl hydrolase family 39 n=1 Tax=Allotamlana fucoidanivorans TaxID=2583814 RepID=A0A5C4SPY1_9FLAO|nr:hypothetical protein [Tamlana fucoidanivorans]TNJ46043.1 hypothetical protein FGF67_03340 [Tamlana fucoidanivorans]
MKKNIKLLLILSLVMFIYNCDKQPAQNSTKSIGQDFNLVKGKVDFSNSKQEFYHFWKSTGYSPGSVLMRKDMQQTMNYLRSVNNSGIVYSRPHYLLNLIGTKGLGTKNVVYDWTLLDKSLDVLVANNQKLIFELMGLFNGKLEEHQIRYDKEGTYKVDYEDYFNDFKNHNQLLAWKRLVKDLAVHLIERYGKEEVRSWYFETTNEPNIEHFWPYDTVSFSNYYDACSEGLKEADPQLRFGGPGTSEGGLGEMFNSILEHCDTGTNYFTGEKGVRLDFISVHVKQLPQDMVDKEKKVIDYIRENHPKFIDKPFVNDEADPLVGWSRDFYWRSGPWYASFVAQSVDLHQKILVEKNNVNYSILSNDNGFMGDWKHRTHFARFSNPFNENNFSLIKKPVFTVMSLLSRLGNQSLNVGYSTKKGNNLGVIPTIKGNDFIGVLIYNKPEVKINYNGEPRPWITDDEKKIIQKQGINLKLELVNLPFKSGKMVHYRLDENHGNPFEKWIEQGGPSFPTSDQIKNIKRFQEPAVYEPIVSFESNNRNLDLEVTMPPSSVSLILISGSHKNQINKVKKPTLKKYNSFQGETDIMIQWHDIENDDLLSYEISFAENDSDNFKIVSAGNLIDCAYVHTWKPETVKGRYKIRAIDIWGNVGLWSDETQINF